MLPEWFDLLGAMRWPLVFCAVFALAIGLERLVFILKSCLKRQGLLQQLSDQLQQHKTQPKPLRDEIASLLINDLQGNYLSGIKLLRVIGTISPLVGLLGTILGIIGAFKVIASHSGAISPSLIANGLWEAMLTTAVGLMVALPALLFAHVVQFFSDRELGAFCRQLNQQSLAFELEKA